MNDAFGPTSLRMVQAIAIILIASNPHEHCLGLCGLSSLSIY